MSDQDTPATGVSEPPVTAPQDTGGNAAVNPDPNDQPATDQVPLGNNDVVTEPLPPPLENPQSSADPQVNSNTGQGE
jgi:hypothetical protein